VDGSQHLDQVEYDARRTAYLAERGTQVLRLWNHEVLKNIEDVLRAIELVLDEI
jgi:very-short-patch-repair endonuclease